MIGILLLIQSLKMITFKGAIYIMANKILKTLTLPNAQGELVTYELHPEWDNIEGKPEVNDVKVNEIAAGESLGALLAPGKYGCETKEIAETLDDCPVKAPFVMDVDYGNGFGPDVTQEISPSDDSAARYYRTFSQKSAQEFLGNAWLVDETSNHPVMPKSLQAIHANIESTDIDSLSEYTGTINLNWFLDNSDATDFYINTPEELFGLANLVSHAGETFEGKTIHIMQNICVCKGDASTWETNPPLYSWEPIANTTASDTNGNGYDNWSISSEPFLGTIDGHNHFISGLYNRKKRENGFIVYAINATIKNLAIINSYFENYGAPNDNCGYHSKEDSQMQASFVCRAYGCHLENLYSDAYLPNKALAYGVGGICGLIGSEGTIAGYSYGKSIVDSCMYSGVITATGELSRTGDNDGTPWPCKYIGAIAGTTDGKAASFYNCLSDATLTYDELAIYSGGLVGWFENGIMEGCVCMKAPVNSSGNYAKVGLVGMGSYYNNSPTLKDCIYPIDTKMWVTGSIVSENTLQVDMNSISELVVPSSWIQLYDSKHMESTSTIAYGTDLNNYLEPGNYSCPNISAAASLDNCPVEEPFNMNVRYTDNVKKHIRQEIKGNESGVTTHRHISDIAGLLGANWSTRADGVPFPKTVLEIYNRIDNFYPTTSETIDTTSDQYWYYSNESSATEFTIYTVAELYGLAEIVNGGIDYFEGKIVKLGADLIVNNGDANEWSATNAPENPWISIGQDSWNNIFKGTFDGQGHYISGLYSHKTSWGGGLFSSPVGATIKNLAIINSYFGNNVPSDQGGHIGSVATRARGSSFYNIYSNAIIECTGNIKPDLKLGGIVGFLQARSSSTNLFDPCKVNSCVFEGSIIGYGGAGTGGIVGADNNGGSSQIHVSVSDCLNLGSIKGDTQVGGIIGATRTNSLVYNCINIGEVSGNLNPGSIVGEVFDNIHLENCYCDTELAPYGTVASGKVANFTGKIVNEELLMKGLAPSDWATMYDTLNKPTISELLTSADYGDTLPTAGTPGRIFFLKVSE